MPIAYRRVLFLMEPGMAKLDGMLRSFLHQGEIRPLAFTGSSDITTLYLSLLICKIETSQCKEDEVVRAWGDWLAGLA